VKIQNARCADVDRPDHETVRSPDSASHRPPRGLRYGTLRGLWPGDIDDGFEKAIREMRDSEIEREPPSWCHEWRE
jgi:hypothetical protein